LALEEPNEVVAHDENAPTAPDNQQFAGPDCA
jgi:hypothetical protein